MEMETTSQFKALDERYFMPAFSRDMAIVKGEGSTVWDAEGKEYLDCVAGIAVCSTGHCHPAVVKAICDQAHELIHCSNLYYVPHQGDLAKKLVEITGMHKAFFSNSGAEATDGALKARPCQDREEKICCVHPRVPRPYRGFTCSHAQTGNPRTVRTARAWSRPLSNMAILTG
ncbi:MAG: aminotransferase class III-fold pyridoxal phosphate-dependent enzyme [Desulfobacterales bacterium]|nr:aminotransferase class III-fold pyridoxal phosphate-dependent enzyme [Desulfobacterales bacterium]